MAYEDDDLTPEEEAELARLEAAEASRNVAPAGLNGFLVRRVAVPTWALLLGGVVVVGLIGASASPQEETAATASTTTTRPTTTTLSAEARAAAEQAAAERAAAAKAEAERAAAERAEAERVAAEQAAAERAAAEKAEADRLAAERAAAAPRTLSGTGSKVTEGFSLVEAGYRVSWAARGPRDNFVLRVRSRDGAEEILVNEIHPEPSSGEEFFDSPGGEFFLVVDASELSWTITLTRL